MAEVEVAQGTLEPGGLQDCGSKYVYTPSCSSRRRKTVRRARPMSAFLPEYFHCWRLHPVSHLSQMVACAKD